MDPGRPILVSRWPKDWLGPIDSSVTAATLQRDMAIGRMLAHEGIRFPSLCVQGKKTFTKAGIGQTVCPLSMSRSWGHLSVLNQVETCERSTSTYCGGAWVQKDREPVRESSRASPQHKVRATAANRMVDRNATG